MRKLCGVAAGAAALALLLAWAPDARAQERGSCVKCHDHEKEAAAEAAGVHVQAGFGCADCHGGNAKAETKALAHQALTSEQPFQGKIPRQEIAKLCARCHSDVQMMNPYGTKTDQYAHYQYSGHGQAMAKGNADAATCVDCHTTHGIRRVRDPQSTVYPKNVPTTCGRCHSNVELMKKYDHKATAEAQYRESVHAELLLKKDDLSAPTCATCHGNHGAVPPGFTDIAHVCGKCHVRQQELFATSPHAKLTKSGDFRGCVTCHGNHKVLRKADAIFKRCSTCHEEGDKAMGTRDMIGRWLAKANERHATTSERVAAMTRAGFHTEEEALHLEEARTVLMQLPPAQHTLDVASLDQLVSTHGESLNQIEAGLAEKQSVDRLKKLALVPMGVFLLGMAVVFARKKKEVESAKEAHGPE